MPGRVIPGDARIVVGGHPQLIIEDRPGVDDKNYRYKAYLKGRSAGGILTGFGATIQEAAEELRTIYKDELAAIELGLRGLDATTKGRR